MMRGLLCWWCLLLYVLCGFDLVVGVDVFNGMLYVPFSGSGHGLQLDVQVLPCAVNSLDTITITLPIEQVNGQTNARLVGPPFQDRLISGLSVHGIDVHDPTRLLVSWDGISKLSFRGFSSNLAVGVVVPASTSPSSLWVNVNWYIPDQAWVDPTVPDFNDNDTTKLPLKLISFQQGTSPHITITKDTYFQAYNNPNITCQ